MYGFYYDRVKRAVVHNSEARPLSGSSKSEIDDSNPALFMVV